MYGLILLGTVSLTVPIAAVIGIGCLVVTMISVFSPAAPMPGLFRSVYLMGGGLISFLINFYLWLFDQEKVLLSAVANSTGVFKGEIQPNFEALMDTVQTQFSQLETYARTSEASLSSHAFNDCFSRIMARLGTMRINGEFDRFPLDARNSLSSFILQIR